MTAMTRDRLRTLIEAYGADRRRWPVEERDAAETLLKDDPAARALIAEAAALDALLAHDLAPPTWTRDAAKLAAYAASQFQPRRRRTNGPASSGTIWRLNLGWPNFAGLAAAAIAGLVIGWSGLDASLGLGGGAEASDLIEALTTVESAEW